MLTETQRQELVQDLYDNLDFRYPLDAGATQYDFNSGNVKFFYRSGEPVEMKYPALKVEFFPRSGRPEIAGISNVLGEASGTLIYGQGELEPVVFTVYCHQHCKGTAQTWHGKLVSDAYIRRVEDRIRKYWPRLLWEMNGAQIKEGIGWEVQDISAFLQGTERQGQELTVYLMTTRLWDYLDSDPQYESGLAFEDAEVSGMDQADYDAGSDYSKYYSVSGTINGD